MISLLFVFCFFLFFIRVLYVLAMSGTPSFICDVFTDAITP